jgi:hypothetical protein
MSKDELWEIYSLKNPAFAGEGTVTMSRAGLRKLFDQTWEQAHAQGVKNGRAAQDLQTKADSLFGKIFG